MLLVINLVGIILFAAILGLVTKKIVELLEQTARITRLGQLSLTSLLIALATSLPEMAVAVLSAFSGVPQLSYGNAIGSNIANISLVIGITALAAGGLPFHHAANAINIYRPLLVTLLPFIFALNGTISRLEGLILICSYFLFLKATFKPDPISASPFARLFNSSKSFKLALVKLAFFAGLLLITSRLIIVFAQSIALQFNLPISFIGFFLISVGTTLPELTFNLRAVSKRHPGMATANIIGSCVANSTLIVGMAALITPIVFSSPILVYLSASEYIFILLLFLIFIVSKKRMEVWEAVLLIFLFIYYTNLEIIVK